VTEFNLVTEVPLDDPGLRDTMGELKRRFVDAITDW
jgi:hypothetical protein